MGLDSTSLGIFMGEFETQTPPARSYTKSEKKAESKDGFGGTTNSASRNTGGSSAYSSMQTGASSSNSSSQIGADGLSPDERKMFEVLKERLIRQAQQTANEAISSSTMDDNGNEIIGVEAEATKIVDENIMRQAENSINQMKKKYLDTKQSFDRELKQAQQLGQMSGMMGGSYAAIGQMYAKNLASQVQERQRESMKEFQNYVEKEMQETQLGIDKQTELIVDNVRERKLGERASKEAQKIGAEMIAKSEIDEEDKAKIEASREKEEGRPQKETKRLSAIKSYEDYEDLFKDN